MMVNVDLVLISSTIGSLTAATGIGWTARFIRAVDRRLTRIETALRIKKILPPEADED